MKPIFLAELEGIFAGDDVSALATAIANPSLSPGGAAAVADAYIRNGTAITAIADALLVAAEYKWQETGDVMAIITAKEQALKREDFPEVMVSHSRDPTTSRLWHVLPHLGSGNLAEVKVQHTTLSIIRT